MKTNKKAVVYGDGKSWYFSDGVNRDFGQNKIIKLITGEKILSSVQPLKCNPITSGLYIVGVINCED